MQRFRGIDFLDLESELSDEERMVRDAVRSFVDERILPIIGKCFDEARFPTELIPEMAAVGLFGPTIPEKYGGQSLGPVAYGLMCRELERGDSGVRSMASVQGALVMYPILEYGSEEQKTRWLPKLAKGEAIGCFGLTEPDAGSNPGGMLSRARKDGNHWVLSGRKMWITNGTISDVSIVWAKDEAGVVRGFLVEKGTKGFSAPETKLKWSLRASVTSELVLDEVRIPEASRSPEGRRPQGAALLSHPSALRHRIRRRRRRDGLPRGGDRLLEDPHRLRQAARRVPNPTIQARRHGERSHARTIVGIARRATSRSRGASPTTRSPRQTQQYRDGLKIARTCRDILGANGILLDYQSGRHLCNLETVYTYEGTHDIHTLAVGKRSRESPRIDSAAPHRPLCRRACRSISQDSQTKSAYPPHSIRSLRSLGPRRRLTRNPLRLLAAAALLFPACAYLRDRGRDAARILEFDVGVPSGLEGHIGVSHILETGVGWYSGRRWGLRSGGFVTIDEERSEFGIPILYLQQVQQYAIGGSMPGRAAAHPLDPDYSRYPLQWFSGQLIDRDPLDLHFGGNALFVGFGISLRPIHFADFCWDGSASISSTTI